MPIRDKWWMSLAMTHSLLQLCHWAALWIMHYKLRLPLLTPVSCFQALATEAFLQTSSLSQRNLANILPLTHSICFPFSSLIGDLLRSKGKNPMAHGPNEKEGIKKGRMREAYEKPILKILICYFNIFWRSSFFSYFVSIKVVLQNRFHFKFSQFMWNLFHGVLVKNLKVGLSVNGLIRGGCLTFLLSIDTCLSVLKIYLKNTNCTITSPILLLTMQVE